MSRSNVFNSMQVLSGSLFYLLQLAVFVFAVAAAPMGNERCQLAVFGLVFSSYGFVAVFHISRSRNEQAKRDQLRILYPG